MHIDASSLLHESSYKLLTGAVVPRPIAWITTGIEPGPINLAPFSVFTILSYVPPMLGFNCGARPGGKKDTALNINAYKEYVIHIADQSLLEVLHLSSEWHPPDVSEVQLLGLETAPSIHVCTPRLTAAPIAMECRLRQTLSFGTEANEFFVGEVLGIHIRDDLYEAGKIDTQKLNPICRVAGPTYASLSEFVRLAP